MNLSTGWCKFALDDLRSFTINKHVGRSVTIFIVFRNSGFITTIVLTIIGKIFDLTLWTDICDCGFLFFIFFYLYRSYFCLQFYRLDFGTVASGWHILFSLFFYSSIISVYKRALCDDRFLYFEPGIIRRSSFFILYIQ